jgi:hypothetical protein
MASAAADQSMTAQAAQAGTLRAACPRISPRSSRSVLGSLERSGFLASS